MNRFFASALFIVILSHVSASQQHPRSIFVVLRGEKSSSAPDAPLSMAGQKRAECLARTFNQSEIKQIFVNESKSSQETAEPVAKALRIRPTIISEKDTSTLVRNLLYGAEGNALAIIDVEILPVIMTRLQGGTTRINTNRDENRLFVITVVEGAGAPAATLQLCDSGPSSGAKSGQTKPGPTPKAIAPKAPVKKQ
jgi:ribosomal protein L22